MDNLRAWAGAVLVLLLGPLAVHGQSVPSPYRYVERGQAASLFAGVLDPGQGRFGYGPSSGLVIGGRYAVEVGGPLALEGVASLFSTTRDVINPGREEGDRKVAEADVSLVMIDARLRLNLTGRRTWHRVTPYVYVGGGIVFDRGPAQPGDAELEQRDRFKFGTGGLSVLGVGSRWFIQSNLALRTDLHLTLYQLDVPEGFKDAERGFEAVANSEWVSGRTLTLALSYLF
ncbi:MAG TPA: hypothetical protein VGA70_06135 [Longimicrobiales bacterium]|jgi:hypothetical protein